MKNKFTGLLLLDLTKAFDTVQHKILLTKLNHYGIRGVVKNFFESYLTNRSQAVIIHDNHSSKSNIDIGVPQGSSLGPLLFLLYINDLPNCISGTPRLFADDTCILVKANTSNELKYYLNYELEKTNDWIVANKLTLNAAKSNAIIIKPKLHSPPVEMNLSCAARSIKVVSSAKYLGVFIGDKLNFQEHIKHLEKKASRSVGIISKLKNYVPTHALLKLYYTLVHSHLLYGLIVLGNIYPTYLSKLIALQNKALRIVTKRGWYQNVSPLYQKFNLLNLQNLHKFETAKIIHNQINQRLYLQILMIISLWQNSHTIGKLVLRHP